MKLWFVARNWIELNLIRIGRDAAELCGQQADHEVGLQSGQARRHARRRRQSLLHL